MYRKVQRVRQWWLTGMATVAEMWTHAYDQMDAWEKLAYDLQKRDEKGEVEESWYHRRSEWSSHEKAGTLHRHPERGFSKNGHAQ